MSRHFIHFFGPIAPATASYIRNTCLDALVKGATSIDLIMSTEGGNLTSGFALYFFLKSLPIPFNTHNIGSVESIGVPIFLAGAERTATPGSRFLIHPLHWGFGPIVAADHARISEWRDCLDFDAERYASIFEQATAGAQSPVAVRDILKSSPKLFTADEAVACGITHRAQQLQIPSNAPDIVHWWNT